MELKEIEALINEINSEVVSKKPPGPLITISREAGCPGFSLAQELSAALAKKKTLKEGRGAWQAINREIINQAAARIKLPADMVERIIGEKSPGVFSQVFRTLADEYTPSDIQVKRAVAKIIYGLTHLGKFIIVGRGGAILTRFVKDSLHIKLYAPLEWRYRQIMKKKGISQEEALTWINEVDREGVYLRNFYAGESGGTHHFDLMFNSASMTNEEIIGATERILEIKKIII